MAANVSVCLAGVNVQMACSEILEEKTAWDSKEERQEMTSSTFSVPGPE